ncbi:RNA polymerase sigma factor [Quadrisphaera sp. KR29]|uniref:RNA polymerase sigma factor n=1 Tax=Quadrisphaera sp. KR29 TaxID=3461391 RepID=UPI004044530E
MAGSGVEDGAARRARFESLAGEVLEPVRRYLARRAGAAVADDALSDVLLVLWRRLDDVPTGDGGAGALPWAYGVARGCLANAERAARRQRRLAARVAAVDPPPLAVPVEGEDDDGRPDPAPVRAALAALRPASAEVLRLWAWEELAPAQIAEVLGVSPNAASIRLHRARKELAEQLRKDGGAAGQVGAGGEAR